jgi:coproporphyrinogen III oxidase
MPSPDDPRCQRASTWFQQLQRDMIAAFERLEDEAPAALYGNAPGRFELTPWTRAEGGGGVMGMLRGRFFEKCGLHFSFVHGRFSPEMAKTMPGVEDDPTFIATGVSLIAHMANPHVPTVHMNTRFITTAKGWFGGGSDLTPMLDYQRRQDFEDAIDFHAACKAVCDTYDPAWHPKFKLQCDEYFHLAHRQEPRGIGGIFYEHHNSGDWERDFAFSQDVGRGLIDIYPRIARRRMATPWTEADRDEQLIRRGRYVEFNLLYDRGTTFGLKTGGNVNSILSSMPPVVKWP